MEPSISPTTGTRVRTAASGCAKSRPNGIVSIVAGTGVAGFTGDGGPATWAQLRSASGVAVDPLGNIYVSEIAGHRIRKIGVNGIINTFAGTGAAGATGDGGPAVNALSVNNKPAFIYFISAGQININTPDDTATGPVLIQVRTPIGISNTGTATRARLSPSLQTVPQFLVGGKQYVVAQTSDFRSFIGRPNQIQGAAFREARPGDTVIVYALGCGPTNPAIPAGVVAGANAPLALPFEVKIGGIHAHVAFAGLAASTVGLYQLNVTIPNVVAGDHAIELVVDGVPNARSLVITVGQ